MGAAIIAVVGTLCGGLLTWFAADWRARSERRRRELREAVLGVLKAFVQFRTEQYRKVDARREGASAGGELRDARWAARSALTTAIDELYAATTDRGMLETAEAARLVAIEIGDAATPDGVDEDAVAAAGRRAREIHTSLRLTAHRTLNH
ncbi:hypothetical protein ACIRF8_15345 [Streptomyces sp. NPDC102406]|uniref:hypothetical protein n=1 Tax=Streptomyces sp. NPDC102406 TaxID=3366171 RepID=UPI0037FCA5B9